MLIDSHCHLDFFAFKDDWREVIDRTLKEDVWLINVGAQFSTSERAIEAAELYPQGVYASIGLHPIHLFSETEEFTEANGEKKIIKHAGEEPDFSLYEKLARSSKKVVAIGEVGLDYYFFEGKSEEEVLVRKAKQQKIFLDFIALAEKLELPLILHCRGSKDEPYAAYDEMLDILKKEIAVGRKIKAVIHCFGGRADQAERFIELGFYVGFTGIITFGKKASEVQLAVKAVPLSRILVETDAPFLTPEPYRGRRNEPAYVKYIAKKIAELKNEDLEVVSKATTENARKFFGI